MDQRITKNFLATEREDKCGEEEDEKGFFAQPGFAGCVFSNSFCC